MNATQKKLYTWQNPEWPRYQYDETSLAAPLAQARVHLEQLAFKLRAIGLIQSESNTLIRDVWVQEALATAAIEGQKLDTDQVRSSVMRKLGMTSTGNSARHIEGLIQIMFEATQDLHVPLTVKCLCDWQRELFPYGVSGMQRIEVGQFRSFTDAMQIVSGTIGREIVHYRAPDSSQVSALMDNFLSWFNAPSEQTHHIDGILRAAIAHLWFETIHPFEDGNGRLGRAIIDRALAQDTQIRALEVASFAAMSRSLLRQRKTYYDVLNAAQTGGMDITPWINWFIQQLSASCIASEDNIQQAILKAQFWIKHAHSNFNPRQRKTLQKLLDAGDGGFAGGMSAEKHSKITGASKATATRDLTDLLEQNALISYGIGKATKYAVNVEGWNQGLQET